MAAQLNSYIHFNGDAKEAVDFYHSVFGGKVMMNTFGEYADKMPITDDDKDKVMHAYIKGDNDMNIMLSDTPAGMPYNDGSRVTLSLSGDDEDILRNYWGKLSEDAEITMPLDKSPWGDTFGMLTDKFGVEWMVNIGPVQG